MCSERSTHILTKFGQNPTFSFWDIDQKLLKNVQKTCWFRPAEFGSKNFFSISRQKLTFLVKLTYFHPFRVKTRPIYKSGQNPTLSLGCGTLSFFEQNSDFPKLKKFDFSKTNSRILTRFGQFVYWALGTNNLIRFLPKKLFSTKNRFFLIFEK